MASIKVDVDLDYVLAQWPLVSVYAKKVECKNALVETQMDLPIQLSRFSNTTGAADIRTK